MWFFIREFIVSYLMASWVIQGATEAIRNDAKWDRISAYLPQP